MRPGKAKHNNKHLRLFPTGRTKPGQTHTFTVTGSGLTHQNAGGQDLGQWWNRTEGLIPSNPGLLVSHLDLLLTLTQICNILSSTVFSHQPPPHGTVLISPLLSSISHSSVLHFILISVHFIGYNFLNS